MSYIICSDLEKNEMNLPPEWNVSLELCDCCCPHSCSWLLPTPQQNMCCAKQTSTRESENLSVSKRLVQNKWAAARGAVGWVGSRDAQKQPQVGLKFLKKPCLPPPAQFGCSSIQRRSGRELTFLLWWVLQSTSVAFTGCHLHAWEEKHLHLSLFNSEMFVGHYPCSILLQRIVMMLFFPAHPHQTSSGSLDLNKLPVLLSIFPYSLFLLCEHPKVPVRISGVPRTAHTDIPCPRGCLSTRVHHYNPALAALTEPGRIFK